MAVGERIARRRVPTPVPGHPLRHRAIAGPF